MNCVDLLSRSSNSLTFTVWTIQCTLYTVYCALYTVYCKHAYRTKSYAWLSHTYTDSIYTIYIYIYIHSSTAHRTPHTAHFIYTCPVLIIYEEYLYNCSYIRVQCALYGVQCTAYSVRCTYYIIHRIMFTIHCIAYTV